MTPNPSLGAVCAATVLACLAFLPSATAAPSCLDNPPGQVPLACGGYAIGYASAYGAALGAYVSNLGPYAATLSPYLDQESAELDDYAHDTFVDPGVDYAQAARLAAEAYAHSVRSQEEAYVDGLDAQLEPYVDGYTTALDEYAHPAIDQAREDALALTGYALCRALTGGCGDPPTVHTPGAPPQPGTPPTPLPPIPGTPTLPPAPQPGLPGTPETPPLPPSPPTPTPPELGGGQGTIQGESGVPVPGAECGALDGETTHSTATGMFFPGLGCTAAYALQGSASGTTLTQVTFSMGGRSGTLCGAWVFGGAVVGASLPACASAGAPITVPVQAVGGTGSAFTVTWVPDESQSTPYWANGFLDSMGYTSV
jgi:hypothetical protein